MTRTEEIVQCETCSGSGRVMDIRPGYSDCTDGTRTCHQCGGMGSWVEVTERRDWWEMHWPEIRP